jgi:spore germination protein GerM
MLNHQVFDDEDQQQQQLSERHQAYLPRTGVIVEEQSLTGVPVQTYQVGDDS